MDGNCAFAYPRGDCRYEVSMKNPLPAFYGLHMMIQAVVSLVSAPALLTLLAWYLHTYQGVGEWIYALLITFGVLTGFYSMIRYLLSASAHSALLEKQAVERRKKQRVRHPLSAETRAEKSDAHPGGHSAEEELSPRVERATEDTHSPLAESPTPDRDAPSDEARH